MKINKTLKMVGLVSMGMLIATSANAQGLNTITGNLLGQFPGVADVMSSLAYIGGIGFGIKAALKLKEYNEAKGQLPISGPITMAIVAALLIALPSLLTTSTQTVFGTGSQKTGLTGGGAIRNIQ